MPLAFFTCVYGTASHAVEPAYPIALEDTVSLYQAVDRTKLQANKGEIIRLFDEESSLTERISRYISAAGSLFQDSFRIALSCTDTAKVHAYAQTLANKYIPSTSGPANEETRMLSAITLQGISFQKDTVSKLADTVIVLDDPYGSVGRTFFCTLRDEALQKGHSIITCYSPTEPNDKIDHLFIPSLRLGFTTSNRYHRILSDNQRTIHYTRFCSAQGLKLRRQRLRFNEKAAMELLSQAFALQADLKECHSRLEKHYIDALDFTCVQKSYQYIISLLEH